MSERESESEIMREKEENIDVLHVCARDVSG